MHSTYLFSGENDRKSPDFYNFILAVLGHTDEALHIQNYLVLAVTKKHLAGLLMRMEVRDEGDGNTFE